MCFNVINSLDIYKDPGLDGIPLFFKYCQFIICQPLSIILNTSLKTRISPTLWKDSFIVSVFKSGVKGSQKLQTDLYTKCLY